MADDGPKKRSLPAHLAPLLGEGLSARAERAIQGVLEGSAERLSTSRVGRALSLSKLAAQGGGRLLLDRARDVLAGAPSEEERASRGMDLAAEMLATFSELRGISMKVGQMLSYVDDALPPEARRVLALLQRDVPPMPFAEVEAQLVRDLGRGPAELFADFEVEPFAAASIGQVHRATTKEGQRVAVKVQYRGIEDAMRADLKNGRVLSMFKQVMFFRTDVKAIMDELEERFLDECDYRKEAAYQEAYRRRFAGHEWVVVPQVHAALSGQRVLTTSLESGLHFYEWIARAPSHEERQRVTRLFYRFYLGSFYLDGIFNCDPHPGNYLFREDGRVVFLDYGCSRRFPEERRLLWIELTRAVHADDAPRLRALGKALGFFVHDEQVDFAAFRELMRFLYEPYLEDAPFNFRQRRPADTFRRMFTENKNLFRLNMPADAVFLNRISFGLVSLMGEIGGTLNCHVTASAYFRGVDPDWPEDPQRAGAGAGMGPAVPSLGAT